MGDGRIKMAKIVLLNEQTASLIAAGEVVERPVSVVKELVENSIDAGADLINVSINDGGIELIKVVDNGYGISQEDVPLAFQRHATSKIKNAIDLHRIRTLGFRGEALPSIAAVADVTIKSRTPDNNEGCYMHIRGGNVLESEPVGCPVGTTISVREIFVNTPARRKHLRSKSTEGGLINELLYKMALTKPQIRFMLENNNREVFRTLGSGKIEDVLVSVYGTRAATKMVSINGEEAGVKISGFISKPELSRSSRQQITVAVNGRLVHSTAVNTALDEAYRGMLTVSRYPVAVILIQLPPEKIDVNVHPAKMKIKMEMEDDVKKILTLGVRKALRETVSVPSLNSGTSNSKKLYPTSEPFKLYFSQPEAPYWKESKKKESDAINSKIEEIENSNSKALGEESKEQNNHPNSVGVATQSSYIDGDKSVLSVGKEYSFNGEKTDTLIGHETKSRQVCETQLNYRHSMLLDMQVVGQVMNSYIIADKEDGIYFIDQHAAHERILFEKYISFLDNTSTEIQYLLTPVNINLRAHEKELLREFNDNLKAIGFIFEDFGRDNFLLRGIPADITPGNSERVIMDVVDNILQQSKISKADVNYKMASLLACKAALKAGEQLSLDAMSALVMQLAQTEEPYTCPHGRPTIVTFTRRELDVMFKRT